MIYYNTRRRKSENAFYSSEQQTVPKDTRKRLHVTFVTLNIGRPKRN